MSTSSRDGVRLERESAGTLRAARAEDLRSICDLQRRIQEHDRIPATLSLEELEGWRSEPYFALATDARVIETDGALVGWARIWHQPSGVREERAYLWGGVAPEHRGRGIGSALFRWQLARATEALRASSAVLPRFVRAHAFDFQESALRLYARHGLRVIRYGNEMLRDLAAIPQQPVLDGIVVRGWDPVRSEEVRVAQNAAFADHWGSTPRDTAAWEHFLGNHGVRLDLSFLALDGDRVVGASLNGEFPEDAVDGRREGWILNVGVVPSHRKRGIASALIAASLAAFRGAGFTHSALSVDTENPTGAFQLYERLGYTSLHRTVVYQTQV